MSGTKPDSEQGAPGTVSTGDSTAPESKPTVTQAPRDSVDLQQMGPYRLLEQIGEGGMGAVYLAEQTEPVRRRVAIKLIKLGMDSQQVIARFETERQALAMMDHPNIARVFDAGTSERGRPYFVMEYIQGVPITEHCDRNRLPVGERLDLFIRVCHAVGHAHQKGIIHRDIKPSNILVEYIDETATPKIIDFGVAKATAHRLTERTLFTERGQLIGTPEYMSPEQAEASGQDVDTRADIYSLGVLLYELLTGTLPFDPETLRQAGFSEIQRIIRDVDPPRPSTKLSSLGQVTDSAAPPGASEHQPNEPGLSSIDEVARNRQCDASVLARDVRGDLDWIVMKCLEKDRTRRYEGVHGLALDIQRHLRHEPVHATPPSPAYRLRKFVRRNRGGVLAGSVVTLALLVALVGISTFAVRETRARVREAEQLKIAEQNEQKAQRVLWFLQNMLESVTPERARGKDTTLLREVLDRAAQQADEELVNQPEALAAVHNTIGITYLGLGRYDEADTSLSAALRIRRRVLGDEHVDVADTLSNLGTVKMRMGDYSAAEPFLQEAVATKRKLFGENDVRLTVTLNNLANALNNLGRTDEAEQIHRQILALRRNMSGNEHPDVAVTLNNLAFLLMNEGKYDSAETMFREALDIRHKLYGDNHPDVALGSLNLGHLLMRTGRHAEAEPLFVKALELRRRLSGDEHPDTGYALNGLASNHHKQGNYSIAEPLFREALPILEKAFGNDDWRVVRVMADFAAVLRLQGKHDEAEAIYHELLARHRQSANAESMIKTLDSLGRVQQARGNLDAAETTIRECLSLRRESLPAGHPGIARSLVSLGRLLAERERPGEADLLYREALTIVEKIEPPDPVAVAVCRIGLGRALTKLGKYAEAESLLLKTEGVAGEIPEFSKRVFRAALMALVDLYDSWHVADPGSGYEAKAVEWRARVDRLQASSQPITPQTASSADGS